MWVKWEKQILPFSSEIKYIEYMLYDWHQDVIKLQYKLVQGFQQLHIFALLSLGSIIGLHLSNYLTLT